MAMVHASSSFTVLLSYIFPCHHDYHFALFSSVINNEVNVDDVTTYSQGLFAAVIMLFLSNSCNSIVPLLKIQTVETCSSGIEFDPGSSWEVDHTVMIAVY
jgi:hypothetical protein